MEMLCFQLPGHGDKTLKHMNLLRCRQHFCDVTIVASNNQTFKGHKVVLAACSPFLRDQFLLNPSPRLQVSMLYSARVVCDLLQSCYTGILQFNPEEIVNYLTAASYLQMEHIVERCRGALKKYVQLKNPAPSKMPSGESHSSLVIVSGSVQSVAPASPPVDRDSPVALHSPELRSVEENNGDNTAQGSIQHGDDSPMLDDQCIKINASEGEEEPRPDYDVFRVYISDEEPANRDREDAAAAALQDACYPEIEAAVMAGESSENDLNPREDALGAAALSVDRLSSFTRRLHDPKAGQGRARGRGRGFKRRRWGSSQDRRTPSISHHQDLWYLAMAGMGGGLGVDYSQEGLKTDSYVSVELPRLDYGAGDNPGGRLSPMATSSLNQLGLEESGVDAGEGSSGLSGVGKNEGGGDESVAVVGSTSSVAGPVICEHCGVTFPSAHSLAVHARSTHLLYACPCCGKHFQQAANLTRHMAVHRGAAKSHQCPLCYKTFTQKSTLIDHMNLHSGERPHRCAYCHARFAHKPALRRHLKEQHGKTTGQNSLHEQEERAREAAGVVQEEEQDCLFTDQVS